MAKKRKAVKKKKTQKKGEYGPAGFFKLFVVIILILIAGIFIYERFFYNAADKSGHSIQARRNIKLFVANGEGLKGVRRSIKKGSVKDEIKETFKILLWADSGVIIPRGTRLLKTSIRGSTAYLNINSAISDNHPGGTSAEMQTIYAIVNSITLNFPAIKDVKILINGKSRKTLAGHIDISVPLGPYRGIITDS